MKPCFIRNVFAPLSGLAALLATAPLVFFSAFDAIEARLGPAAPADPPPPEPLPAEPLPGALLLALAAGALAGYAAMTTARALAR